MLHRCEKCGATTRWYDEKCPSCGTAQRVETPTSPIELPRFAPSLTRRDEENAAASQPAPKVETPSRSEPALAPKESKITSENRETQVETPSRPEPEVAQEETERLPQNQETQDETRKPTRDVDRQEGTAQTSETADATEETATPPERPRRFTVFRRAVDAWRLSFAAETASVTLPRVRVVRYAIGIVAELVLCFPCALLAAYFFTGALLADRRALYHAAMQETEKARRTLLVGLGVFAAFLCAFIFYVQSQEIAAPKDSGPASFLFKK